MKLHESRRESGYRMGENLIQSENFRFDSLLSVLISAIRGQKIFEIGRFPLEYSP